MNAKGTVTTEGQNYADGTERLFIGFNKDCLGELPARVGERVPFHLLVNGERLKAGIRMTERNPLAWICPDAYDVKGEKHRLPDILSSLGIEKNDTVQVKEEGDAFVIYRSA
jgi:hypothetical protein